MLQSKAFMFSGNVYTKSRRGGSGTGVELLYCKHTLDAHRKQMLLVILCFHIVQELCEL